MLFLFTEILVFDANLADTDKILSSMESNLGLQC